jgi:hypothetical protein
MEKPITVHKAFYSNDSFSASGGIGVAARGDDPTDNPTDING